MSEEFPIQLELGKTIRTLLYSQLCNTTPYPTQSFAGQTVIVTGSNIGLGLEAARHFYRLNCTRLILGVRTISKGQTAKQDIVRSVQHRTDADAIEVWPLDLSNTDSTLSFANRVKHDLPRIDVLVENAGLGAQKWSVVEGFEQSIQVNVINTLLLALSLLPKLKDTAVKYPESSPHLVLVSSDALRMTKFKQINDPDIYQSLNIEKDFNGLEWYCISKLLDVLFVRELVDRVDFDRVVFDLVNPGMSRTAFTRDASAPARIADGIMRRIMGRSSEVGSRALVLGASAGPDSHGQFMNDGQNQWVAKWVDEDVGRRAQRKVFDQTMKILEMRSPGVGKAVGL
ncbi:hypothetical protein LTR10_015173 [Elasticomyces elasticus]|uniref:Ketoreductase (KR) domain-containing protein n=1 Tax=Exophiala sideris TaxID=1016849 RepID=A0ABR0JEC9_9EURO|nr:hypothetical protein LTR10_015173 [Elasticomyces elasticus]KAK5032646.1 hypothetical protein LTS07_004056 [Exophiala sideris]KAK5037173.1 hypothetical protein LTR13_004978 [Exophiala sideris]KAK5062171.1 hypothetical protein LTR69_004529 [Exophiala sideris]KAK5182331.1 hypothetical protein LTR44_005342 [Eurotiomycetes sp. CCFEE 6388]